MTERVIVFCGTGILKTLAAWMVARPSEWKYLSVGKPKSASVGVNSAFTKKRNIFGFFDQLDEMSSEQAQVRQNNAFAASSEAFREDGNGQCESLNKIIDCMDDDRFDGTTEWWKASIETKILYAYSEEFNKCAEKPRVTLISANGRSNRWANSTVSRVLKRHGWSVEAPTPLETVKRGLTFEGHKKLVNDLRPVLFGGSSTAKSDVLMAGGYKDLHRVVPQLAAVYGLSVWQLADWGDSEEGSLQAIAGPGALGNEPTVASLIEDIRSEPAEVFAHRSGRSSMCSEQSVERMEQRARQWQFSGLWRDSSATYMIEYGAAHGRHIGRISNALFRASPVVADLDEPLRDLAYEALSAAAWLADIGMRPTETGVYTVDDPAHLLLARGILSEKFIVDNSEALGLAGASEQNFAPLVGALCRFRMPSARLHSEEADEWNCPFDSASCRPCSQLHRASASENLWRVAADLGALSPDLVVAMGAILQMADAADFGVHRVSPYWDAIEKEGLRDVWFREQVWGYLGSLPDRLRGAMMDVVRSSGDGPPEKMLSEIDGRFLRAARRDLSEAETRDVVGRLRAIGRSLEKQLELARCHRVVARVDVVTLGAGEVALRLAPSAEWGNLESSERNDIFGAITDDILRQYSSVREFFATVKIELRRIDGPDDLTRVPEDYLRGAERGTKE